MAFRKWSLEAISGFDPQFRIAGDDVVICWRLQEHGWTVGFSPGAVVWHHRRDRVSGYFKQQYEYGKAEALLERKWPERYNRAGHLAWAGRVYGNGSSKARGLRRWKIYYGTWGQGLFQSVYQRSPGILGSLPLMPEWYLVIATLAVVSAMGFVWTPLFLAFPLFLVAAGALIYESTLGGLRASVAPGRRSRALRLRMRSTIALLYLLQPAARLGGRLRFGLAPWRRRGIRRHSIPRSRTSSVWSERWQSPDTRLHRIESELREDKCVVERGGDFERWDLQVRGGSLGSARMRLAVEEHGGGKQLLRFRVWPRPLRVGLGLVLALGILAASAAIDGTLVAAVLIGAVAVLLAGSIVRDCAAAMGVLVPAVVHHSDQPRAALRAEPSSNGAIPSELEGATRLVPRVSSNGSHPDRAKDIANGNGSLGVPAPIRMRQHGLNLSDRED